MSVSPLSLQALPSRFLPPVRRDATTSETEDALQQLERYLDAADDDAWERSYAQQWLTRLIARACELDTTEGEALLARASALLSRLSGPSGQPASTTTYSFPLHLPGRPPDTLELSIRSETLVGDSTGALIWPAGRHLARRIARDPLTFFPPAIAEGRLRVLELGSGTGLVGIVAAAVLGRMDFDAEVVLSDNDPYSLANLEGNLALNAALLASPRLHIATRTLDWNAEDEVAELERFGVILGGDVVYDVHHARFLRSALESHLAVDATAHIVMSLRPTHTVELRQVDVVFVEDQATKVEIVERVTEEVEGEPLRYETLTVRWKTERRTSGRVDRCGLGQS